MWGVVERGIPSAAISAQPMECRSSLSGLYGVPGPCLALRLRNRSAAWMTASWSRSAPCGARPGRDNAVAAGGCSRQAAGQGCAHATRCTHLLHSCGPARRSMDGHRAQHADEIAHRQYLLKARSCRPRIGLKIRVPFPARPENAGTSPAVPVSDHYVPV